MITAETLTDEHVDHMRLAAVALGDTATCLTCDVALGHGVETTPANVAAARAALVPIWNQPTADNLTEQHLGDLALFGLDGDSGEIFRVVELARDTRPEWRGARYAARERCAFWYAHFGLPLDEEALLDRALVCGVCKADDECTCPQYPQEETVSADGHLGKIR